MKEIIFKLLLLGAALPLSGQIDESKLPKTEVPMAINRLALEKLVNGGCCSCPSNVLKDGGFEKLVIAYGANIAPASQPWSVNSGTPQWTNAEAVCNLGYISMWGNKVVGESVKQLPIPPGKYQGKFTARFGGPSANCKHVQLQILVGTTPVYTSQAINNTQWACYQIPPFTAPAGTQVVLRPVNEHSKNDGAYVSWIHLDHLCLEKVPDCNCDVLAKEFKVEGPVTFCKPLKCDSMLTFSAPKLDPKCFTYSWAVSSGVKFTGQGTHQISIPCSAVKAGKYEMKVSITCNGKTVSAGHVFTVCEKPDPKFSVESDGNMVTLASTIAGNHQWAIFIDKNNNCTLDAGDVQFGQWATGNAATFSSLQVNTQYMVMHHISNSCGKRCVAMKSMCFKFLPAQARSTGGESKGQAAFTKISEYEEPVDTNEQLLKKYSRAAIAFPFKADAETPSKAVK